MRSAGFAACAVLLSACAQLPPLLNRSDARQHLEFYTHAVNATPATREQMWRENATAPAEEAQLRKALLQSIPGSARYNPNEAEAGLRALLAGEPSAEIAAVARMRLETLRTYAECRSEADMLKKRLSKIADIERGADAPVHTQRP